MKLGEHGIGLCQSPNSFCVRFKLCARHCKKGDVVGENIEICACAATSETEAGAPRIHDLGNTAHAGRPIAGAFRCSSCCAASERIECLARIYEQQHNIGRQRRVSERSINNVLRLFFENGNERKVLFADIVKPGEDLQGVHQVGLLRRGLLQMVGVNPNRAEFVFCGAGGESRGCSILPKRQPAGTRPLGFFSTPSGIESAKQMAIGGCWRSR
jgi:hypothetical protein